FSFAANEALSLSTAYPVADRSRAPAAQFHLYAAGRARFAGDAARATQPADADRPEDIAPDGSACCSATVAWTKGARARSARYAHGPGSGITCGSQTAAATANASTN